MTERGLGDERGLGVVSVLCGFALAVQGFHPYAEDGGLYVAGIKKVLDPGLYPVQSEFVEGHLRFSLFAPMVAGLRGVTHVPLPWLLLVLYGASVWLTLFGGWMLASRCIAGRTGRLGAVTLLACWLTLPVAGTSLLLVDPCLTARSLSTPLVMVAMAWALDAIAAGRRRDQFRGASKVGLMLLAAATLHPLMAGYGVAAVVVLAVAQMPQRRRRVGMVALLLAAMIVAVSIEALAPRESAEYVRVALTRHYWFPALWTWYEQVGLVAPLLVLAALGWWRREQRPWVAMVRMAVALGAIATAVAFLFAREGADVHLVARLQPLRSFQIVYEVMIMFLGAWIAERWLERVRWRWMAMLVCLGGTMFAVQRTTFLASSHFEIPGRPPTNGWVEAFVWVSENTPRTAVFAMDSHYITQPGEDAQGFRGIAERTMLPDYSKDGGEASITPALAGGWAQGQAAQTNLDNQQDDARISRLRPLGAGWVVLGDGSWTEWTCPYRNALVKVCVLPLDGD